MVLEVELNMFEANRLEWVKAHSGKFVVVQGKTVLGFFDQWEDGVKAGYTKFGVSHPFLVKEVFERDRVYFIGAAA